MGGTDALTSSIMLPKPLSSCDQPSGMITEISLLSRTLESPASAASAAGDPTSMQMNATASVIVPTAEYTVVPESIVFPIHSKLGWTVLGALPEMLQTCNGSLHIGLEAAQGETLLIRGGTSSIGMTTMAMAKSLGLRVALTTRNPVKRDLLLERGADEVYVDDGALAWP